MMVERAPSIDSESTSSTISTSAMRAILEKLKWDWHRSSTQQQYYCVWKMFNDFFIKLDDKPNEWTDQLNLFVAYLANTGKKSTTIKSYASAIKAILYQGGVVISEDRSTINSVTRACRLHTDKYKIRLPITKSLLRRILDETENAFKSCNYLATLYGALFSTAYFGLFRMGEITKISHVVSAADVQVGTNKKKLCFIIRNII